MWKKILSMTRLFFSSYISFHSTLQYLIIKNKRPSLQNLYTLVRDQLCRVMCVKLLKVVLEHHIEY